MPADPVKPAAHDADRPRLATVFDRLDAILSQLDREDVDLEDQMQLYREACGLLGVGRNILEEARAEIEFLGNEADGGQPASAG
jgi:exodeoxyribonuclease VII small subunit